MSPGTSPDAIDFRGWMRDMNRRMRALENKPPGSSALELLGPGIDSTSFLLADWNDDTACFNGMYYSEVGALNAPDGSHRFVGLTVIEATGSGYQLLWAVPDATLSSGSIASWTHVRKQRIFNTPEGSTRVYSPWVTA